MAEENVIKDLIKMKQKGIIDNNTTFIICSSHPNKYTTEDTADILTRYLKENNFTNKIIINNKHITNPEILKNINKLVDINSYNKILRIAKAFVARRWFMNANNYDFPIDKCDFYGISDMRNITKKEWYLSEKGINQVMKEFINIGTLTIDKELTIKNKGETNENNLFNQTFNDRSKY